MSRRCLLLIYFLFGFGTAILCMSYCRNISALTSRFFPLPHTSTRVSRLRMATKPVIIVGSGLAGLSAAYEALKAGATVHMLDRATSPGGNSIKASSGINGAGTKFQISNGILNDGSFYDDTVRSAGINMQQGPEGVDRMSLIRILTEMSADAIDWLTGEIGVDLSVVAQLGGHSVARTHRGVGNPPGASIVTALLKKLNENPDYSLSTSANVESLIMENKKVTGVHYSIEGEKRELHGPVVFTTGGFAGDSQGLLAKYRPDLEGMPSTNEARPGSHSLLSAIGGQLVDMESVQVHPTGFVDPKDPAAPYKFLAAEALRGEGGILLSEDGERFVNEMEKRDVVSHAIMSQPQSHLSNMRQWDVTLLLDPGACEATGSRLGFYLWKGLMRKVKVIDLPLSVIDAIDRYAEDVASGHDTAFGRETYGHWRLRAGETNRDEEVCIGTITPVIHFTMGGVAVNSKTRVLGKHGERLSPVEGIWSAGEISGGIHGANRLGGSSLLECAVFGRIAGTEAAKSLLKV
ncbi:flavocytochrome c [Xylariaceae sp. FL0016]|nr:flavocytochrome c [Xylariaceae sp. FL0016]